MSNKTTIKRMAGGKQSFNALGVTKEIKKKVRKGEKINLQEIQKKHGYSKKSAKSMKVKETQTWKDEMEPFIKGLKTERESALKDMKTKRKNAKYRDLTDAIDKLTKNIQLLSDKPTEKSKIELDDEQLKQLISSRGRSLDSE